MKKDKKFIKTRTIVTETIKMMRELLGIKQTELANLIGITRSAYNQFEFMRASLSIENVYSICEALKINKDWLEDKSEIFLKSMDVLYLQSKNKDLIHKFLATARRCSYLHIIIPDTVLLYLVKRVFWGEYIITIVYFENNTVCVLKTPGLKAANDFYEYYESMYAVLEKAGIPFSYAFIENFENKKQILEKIETKTVTKEELISLFELINAANINISLSVEEKELILRLRKNEI